MPPPRPKRARVVPAVAALVLLAGCVLLGLAASQLGPVWLDGIGSVAVVTAMSWALAARTHGRALVTALVVAVLGALVLLTDLEALRSGAAVMTAVVAAVLGVMATVPAVTLLQAAREVVVACVIAAVGAFAVLGFEPVVTVTRFEYASVILAFVLVLALVHRLGAGLHGLGRRGLLVVVAGTVLLLATMAYGELVRRYGITTLVEPVVDVVTWVRERFGAFPRPLMVLLGVPALVWGCHMRARRRQGWWVCTFGVAATTPVAQALVNPGGSYLEAGLQVLYGLVLGLVLGAVAVRLDVAITGRSKGSRRSAMEPTRPEPPRLAGL